MKKTILILLLLSLTGFTNNFMAQSGGKKREGGVKARKTFSLKRTHSAGHADKFARSTGRKGLFSRLFKKDRPAWVYRQSGTNKSNWRENRFLFTRHRSPGRQENERYQQKENSRREKRRNHGNDSFKSRKYH